MCKALLVSNHQIRATSLSHLSRTSPPCPVASGTSEGRSSIHLTTARPAHRALGAIRRRKTRIHFFRPTARGTTASPAIPPYAARACAHAWPSWFPRDAHLCRKRASHENGALCADSRPKPLPERPSSAYAAYCTPPAETLGGPHARFRAAAPRRDFNRRAGQPGNGASLLLHALTFVDADPFGMAGGMIQNVTFEQIGIGVHPALHKLNTSRCTSSPPPFHQATSKAQGVRYLHGTNHAVTMCVTRKPRLVAQAMVDCKAFLFRAMLEANCASAPEDSNG